jgi:hypothetical protein
MHTFAQKKNLSQNVVFLRRPTAVATDHQAADAVADTEAIAATNFAHDFSRIPISADPPATIQAKPTLSAPGDAYEQEADHIADQITQQPERQLARACSCGGSCFECGSQRELRDQNTAGLPTRHVRQSDAIEFLFGHDANFMHTSPATPATSPDRLTLSQPDDYFEKEADRVADHVMRLSDGPLDSPVTKGPGPQRLSFKGQAEPCRNTPQGLEDGRVSEGAPSQVSPQTEREIGSVVGSGEPMPESLRDFFEPRFDQDFSHVRIHTGHVAGSTSQRLHAVAFTYGSDIFFGAGQYRPDTAGGLGLLAHELAHVIQQDAGSVSRRLIQRAKIPYRSLTWADFTGSAPADAIEKAKKGLPTEGAGIASDFDIPGWTKKEVIDKTKTPCKPAKKGLTDVRATVSIDPSVFDKLEAYMDTDLSWALDRFKGDGKPFCTNEAAKCEKAFDDKTASVNTDCGQTVDQCKQAMGQRHCHDPRTCEPLIITIGGQRVPINSIDDCTDLLLKRCREISMKGFEFGLRQADKSAIAKAKGDCKKNFFKQCMDNEPLEHNRLLNHEQYHFKITKVLAEQARVSLKAKAATLTATETGCGEQKASEAADTSYANLSQELTTLAQDWKKAHRKAQDDYDSAAETNHGANSAKQKDWEAKINSGLKGYGPAAPTPAAPPTTPAPTKPTPPPAP